MGVYIPGMKMPTEEAVGIFLYPDGRAHLWRTSGMVGQQYEAVPVPEHGRLIDADAIKAKAIERSEKRGVCVNVLDKVITAYDIETAPTIIPAEEVRKKQ